MDEDKQQKTNSAQDQKHQTSAGDNTESSVGETTYLTDLQTLKIHTALFIGATILCLRFIYKSVTTVKMTINLSSNVTFTERLYSFLTVIVI